VSIGDRFRFRHRRARRDPAAPTLLQARDQDGA
jgi:hypothetical protein